MVVPINPGWNTPRWLSIIKPTTLVKAHIQLVEVMCPDLGKDPGLDGVARGVKQRLCDLVPLAIHLGLIIHIHAHNVLVDPEQVDDWMAFVHKDIWNPRDLAIVIEQPG